MDFMLSKSNSKVFKAYYRKVCEIDSCIELKKLDLARIFHSKEKTLHKQTNRLNILNFRYKKRQADWSSLAYGVIRFCFRKEITLYIYFTTKFSVILKKVYGQPHTEQSLSRR